MVAGKADAFNRVLTGRTSGQGRDRFRFTRKGEYRIKNCRKVDLGCGYRIVCIQKDHRLVLLFIGTHDDCFRWIERHRTAEYDLDGVPEEAWTAVIADRPAERPRRELEHDEECLAEEYEESLMDKIDDGVLRKVFAGIVNGRT